MSDFKRKNLSCALSFVVHLQLVYECRKCLSVKKLDTGFINNK